MLLTSLAETPGLDIVSPQRVHEALKLAGHTDLASLDRSEAADVARRAGAGAVVPARSTDREARSASTLKSKIYRRLLPNSPDQKYVALYEPRYVLQLARLLEQAGDRQAARAEYLRFLELWQHANANLPELAEARRALARN